MAADDVAIANLALGKIGSSAITSLTQSGSNEAVAINNVYTDILDEVLSEHPWTFAQKRLALTPTCPDDVSRTIDDVQFPVKTITGATAANPVVITSAAHGFSDGDWVKITAVVGMTQLNGEFYIVDDATTNTFSLNDTDGDDVDGSAFTAWSSAGSIHSAFEMPALGTRTVVVYDRPSDMVKLISKNEESATIAVELDKIIADVEDLSITYTYRNTTVTQYFQKFVQALALRLASEVAFTIMHSVSKTTALRTLYEDEVLPAAVSVDSNRGTPIPAMQDEWLDSRLTGGRQTTGQTWHPA